MLEDNVLSKALVVSTASGSSISVAKVELDWRKPNGRNVVFILLSDPPLHRQLSIVIAPCDLDLARQRSDQYLELS